jgi:hypothetical protein
MKKSLTENLPTRNDEQVKETFIDQCQIFENILKYMENIQTLIHQFHHQFSITENQCKC